MLVPGGRLRRLAWLLALSLAACAGEQAPIVIGVAGPFSEPRGESMRLAAQLAEREVNAGGGVQGRPIRLVFADDSATEAAAMRIAEAFAADPAVVAVVGHLTSGTSLAAGRVYGPARLPMISPSASSPALSGLSPYVFRICPTDLSHGPALARYARETVGAARVGLIYANNDYGRGVRRTFAEEFRRLGGTIVREDPVLPTTASVEPYLARLARSGGVQALVLAAERTGAEVALSERAGLGLAWPVLGGDALTGIEGLGPLAEGVAISSAYLPDRPSRQNAAFVGAYQQAYGDRVPDHRGAGAYDIVHLLVRAIGEVGADRRAVRDYLARVGRDAPAYEGVTGRIAFDAHGDVPGKPVVIGVVRNGRLVSAEAPGAAP